jgi:septal ring-binding cell division protein DamX
MTWSSILRKLLLGISLVILVAGGCKERQEPAPPEEPALVRKKIELPKPSTAQAVKPADKGAAIPVIGADLPKPESPELPPTESAEVAPAITEAAIPPVAVGTQSEGLSIQGKLRAGTYTINLASFRQRQRADQHVEKLKKLGIAPFIWEVDLGDKGKWHRVSVGTFSTLGEAKDYKKGLIQKGVSDTLITKIP